MTQYWLNAYALWGIGSRQINGWRELKALIEKAYPHDSRGNTTAPIDGWCRGVLELTDEQSAEIRQWVDEWNEEMPTDTIFFGPDDGSQEWGEVRVSPNGHTMYGWRRKQPR